MTTSDIALLVLEDGTVFKGRAWGARGRTLGEIVFSTGMTRRRSPTRRTTARSSS